MALRRFCEGCDKEIHDKEFYFEVSIDAHEGVIPEGDSLAGAYGEYCFDCGLTKATPDLAEYLAQTHADNATLGDLMEEMSRTMRRLDESGRLPTAEALREAASLRNVATNIAITLRNSRHSGLSGGDCQALALALDKALGIVSQPVFDTVNGQA